MVPARLAPRGLSQEAFLKTQGLLNLCTSAETPYGWSTNLDFEHGDHSDWEAGGEALLYYLGPAARPDAFAAAAARDGGRVP